MSDSLDIGVDVDSKEFVPAVADRKAGDRVANTRAGIAKWLKTLPLRCRIGMEATGRYYELLARMAGQAGHVVYVIDPRLIKNYARATGSRGKTDAMDAQAIARYVKKESDRLREYVPRTDEQQQMHDLLRKRRALVETRARLEQSFGVSKSDPGELSDLFCALAGTLSELESELQRLGRDGEHGALYKRLLTIPGIGPAVASHLIYYMTRWPLANANAWIACTGLDPRPNESGGRAGRRRLSKQGAPMLRQMLYMAAMGLKRCRQGQPLYDELSKRGHPSTAVFNILARKLARIAWGVFKSGRDFDPAMLKVGQACFQQA
ncbi:transposase [Stenotrophomonas sp. NY11291]|uniref:IS110 family transposase n=1 Tax=Stenotrophomonas sp. NY11291 TaxID=2939415 RepID=UPI002010784C|nr:transposase [Stenotrophomonas sp. NY11291]UQA23976.1 transposase [Stenotrophomonas sp. NY11291]